MVTKANNRVDGWYKDLLHDILHGGKDKSDRTGTGTRSVFGRMFSHDMSKGFPLLTSKEVHIKSVLIELFWFLGVHMKDEKYSKLGRTNIRYLLDNKCYIWVGDAYKAYVNSIQGCSDVILSREAFIAKIKEDDPFAMSYGVLGPIYGQQWRSFGGTSSVYKDRRKIVCDADDLFDSCDVSEMINTVQEFGGFDQIDKLINDLKVNPDSRRLMVTAWNPLDIETSVLPPCHYGFQCYTEIIELPERLRMAKAGVVGVIQSYRMDDEKAHALLDTLEVPRRRLSLSWNQRSVDVPLGLPFNIASYGFLLEMLCKVVNMVPAQLVGYLGDTHIYNNQREGVEKQIANETFPLPALTLTNRNDLTDFTVEDFVLVDYKSAGKVEYPLSN